MVVFVEHAGGRSMNSKIEIGKSKLEERKSPITNHQSPVTNPKSKIARLPAFQ
jgi:hypothetical protein